MPIENLKKHAGQLSNTGVRVAVVFRKLPNDETNCLIVETERLPDSYHDTIIQCLNSKESSETNEFYEVLNRRTFPDGLNCLAALHQRGFLRKEPVSNITMMPLPGHAVPLALINATIDKKVDQYVADQKKLTDVPADNRTPEEKQKAAEELAAKMQSSKTVGDEPYAETPEALAKRLLSKAEVLMKEVDALREAAYQAVPDLRPGRGRPATPEELKDAKLEERKAKRREREQKKAADAKAAKIEAGLDAKVAAKLERDAARLSP